MSGVIGWWQISKPFQMKAGKPRPKVFLAYGVSGSHNRFKEQMKALRQSLRSSGFLMIEADPAVGNPYQAACAAVHAADAIVVVCDYHSNGNGMVIERASWMRKPIVLVRDVDLGTIPKMSAE